MSADPAFRPADAPVDLTPAQRAAVAADDGDCAVVASAGAGKTLVLVERAVWLLATGRTDLDGLVCITFTNKAAEELKDRLRRRLRELAADGSGDPRWAEALDRLDRARISTIHAFCARLLRENPVEAAVDPRFATLEGPEALALRRELADAAVLEALDSGRPEAARLVAAVGRARLVDTLLDLDEAMRVAGLTAAQVRDRTRESLAGVRAQWDGLRDGCATAAATYLDAPAPTGASRARQERFRAAWEAGLRDRLARLEPALDEAARATLADLEAAVREATPGNLPAALRDAAAGLKDAARACLEAGWALACGPLAEEVLRQLERFAETYEAAKAARSALDFHDLQWKALELLRRHPAVRQAYRERLRYVLVDEFQDTDGLQAQLLAELCGALPGDAGSGPRPWLMVVGDPKQSIYRFRGADVEIFRRVSREIKARGGAVLALDENHRSRPELVRLTNAIFGAIRDLPDGGASPDLLDFRGATAFRRPPEDHPADRPRADLILVPVDDGTDTGTQANREAEAVAEWIRAAVGGPEPIVVAERLPDGTETPRPARWGDICILLRAGTHAWRFERALRLAGVPYHSQVARGFFHRQEVLDARYWLRAVKAPGDEWAWFAALRSPAFALSDETLFWLAQGPRPLSRALERWPDGHPPPAAHLAPGQADLLRRAREVLGWARRARDRTSLAGILEGIMDATGVRAVLLTRSGGEQAVANLEKLVAFARAFEAGGPRTAGDFLDALERAYDPRDEEGEAVLAGEDADAVRITTIHRAKGLEFPVVVLADTGRPLGDFRERALLDADAGLLLNLADRLGAQEVTPARWGAAAEAERLHEHFERQRLLYVALTRARDYLVISGAASKLNIHDAFPKQSRWLDWICRVLELAGADGAPGEIRLGEGAEQARIRVLVRPPRVEAAPAEGEPPRGGPQGRPAEPADAADPGDAADAAGPAGEPDVEATADAILRRALPVPPPMPALPTFSVTQLLAFRRCRRAYALTYLLGLGEAAAGLPGGGPAGWGDGGTGDGDPDAADPPALAEAPRGRRLVAEDIAAGLEAAGEAGAVRGAGAAAGGARSAAGRVAAMDPLVRGRVAHRACELLGPPDGPRDPARSARLPDPAAALEQAMALEGVPPAERATLRGDLLPLLERYLAGDWYRALCGAQWVRSELAFSWRADGRARGASVLFHGAIDKAYAGPDGRVTILDFKTDRVTPGEIPGRAERYRLQLLLYALAGVELFGWDVGRCALYFMEPGEAWTCDVTPAVLAGARAELEAAVQDVLAFERAWAEGCAVPPAPADAPEARAGDLLGEGCGACPHPSLCAALGGAYAAASSKTASGR